MQSFALNEVEYVCPDTYVAMYFNEEPDVITKYKKAMAYAEYKRNQLLAENQSMIIETVLSRRDKLDFLNQAKEQGYRIVSAFVGTNSSEINVKRVSIRVSQGGHDVPIDKIKSRYDKSLANLPLLLAVSDELYVYDNSKTLQLVFSQIDEETHYSEPLPAWVKNALNI